MPLAPRPIAFPADEVTKPLGQAVSKGHSLVRIGSPDTRACQPHTPMPHDPKGLEADRPLEGLRLAPTPDQP